MQNARFGAATKNQQRKQNAGLNSKRCTCCSSVLIELASETWVFTRECLSRLDHFLVDLYFVHLSKIIYYPCTFSIDYYDSDGDVKKQRQLTHPDIWTRIEVAVQALPQLNVDVFLLCTSSLQKYGLPTPLLFSVFQYTLSTLCCYASMNARRTSLLAHRFVLLLGYGHAFMKLLNTFIIIFRYLSDCKVTCLNGASVSRGDCTCVCKAYPFYTGDNCQRKNNLVLHARLRGLMVA